MSGVERKIVLVTGGSGGLGRALAKAFSERGCRVVIIARDSEKLATVADKMARNGVTVNAICPGYVDDERTRENARMMAEKTAKSVGEVLALFAASSPQNRLIAPDEMASLALLMASEKLGGMTGQAVNIDGGAVMV